MKLHKSLWIVFGGTFLFHYFVISAVCMNVSKDASVLNVGKSYKSGLMATFVAAMFIMMHDNQYNVFSTKYYIGLIFMSGVFIYLYRNQIWIREDQYLREMNETCSSALLISECILKKTSNFDIARFAKNVVQKTKDEMNIIHEVREKLQKKVKIKN